MEAAKRVRRRHVCCKLATSRARHNAQQLVLLRREPSALHPGVGRYGAVGDEVTVAHACDEKVLPMHLIGAYESSSR